MTWVKCSERMPDIRERVLAVRGHYIVLTMRTNGWGKNKYKLYWEGHSGAGPDYFTHWMPLPEPPKDNA